MPRRHTRLGAAHESMFLHSPIDRMAGLLELPIWVSLLQFSDIVYGGSGGRVPRAAD